MSRLPSRIRHHLPFIIILPLLIIVMTWPTIVYVVDTDSYWLPSKADDIFFKIWDVWYGRQVLAGRADLLYTDLQFFPKGMSLVYHQFAIPHMIAVGLLETVMPVSNAYNLCFLLMLFINAWSTYLLLVHIFRDKWLSLFGAALVGLNPLFLDRSTIPDITLIATLPLAIYFFHRSIIENRLAFAVYSGLSAGVTVFISMYIFVCISLTLGVYGLFLSRSRWTNRRFWLLIVILLCVLVAVSIIRVGPLIADREAYNEALEKDLSSTDSNDLLGFFILPTNPISSWLMEDAFNISKDKSGYLGFIPLLLILLGFASSGYRRQMLPWLVILALFLLLALDETLTVNSVQYPNIVLPKRFLDRMFPALFKSFWNAKSFQIGAVLPLAVLACYGLSAVLNRVSPGHAAWLVMPLVVLIAMEYFVPREGRIITKGQTRFIEWLKTENQDPIRLIHLPMGRYESKYYSFLQSISGHAHANGVANRTLREFFSYIDANSLLSAWRSRRNFFCFPTNAKAFGEALDQLIGDGFTHIVLHRAWGDDEHLPVMFPHAPPAYMDFYVYVYRLPDMRQTCRHTAFLSNDVFPQLFDVLPPSVVKLGHNASLLSIHPAAGSSGDATLFYARILETSPGVQFLPLEVDDLIHSLSEPSEQENNAERKLLNNRIVLLVYDRQATATDLIDAYTGWIASHFKPCGQGMGASMIVEYFAKDDISCALLTADRPFEASYENGMKLANVLLQRDGEQLELHLLWERLTQELHSVSLQVFDEADTRVLSFDRTVPEHSGPAFDLSLDLSSLAPGDYLVKLIVYDYESRVSVSGAVAGANRPFDRELELVRLTID